MFSVTHGRKTDFIEHLKHNKYINIKAYACTSDDVNNFFIPYKLIMNQLI